MTGLVQFRSTLYKGVLFDMDGLVLDTETTYITAWAQAASYLGYDQNVTFFEQFSGYEFSHFQSHLTAILGDDFPWDHFNRLSSEIWHEVTGKSGITVMPGVQYFLDELQQGEIPFALATNSSRKSALCCLERAGMSSFFPHMVASDDVANAKPAPDVFLKAAETLSLRAEDCIALEDSIKGMQAAIASGATAVWVHPHSSVKQMVGEASKTGCFSSMTEAMEEMTIVSRKGIDLHF